MGSEIGSSPLLSRPTLPLDPSHGLDHSPAEVFQKSSHRRVRPPFVIVMGWANLQSRVVLVQSLRILLLQGIEAMESIASPMQYECGQQTSGLAISVIPGVDGHELVVGESRHNGDGPVVPGQFPVDPIGEFVHERGDVTGFGR